VWIVPPVAEPAKGDWRFKDEEWSKNFVFDYLKQSYLITARHMQQAVAQVKGLPPESQAQGRFSRVSSWMRSRRRTS